MAFDVITPVKLAIAAILVSTDIVYTVPALTRTLTKNIDICNTNAFPVKITLYLVPTGDSPTDANTLLSSIIVKDNSIFQWSGIQVLNAGDTIRITGDKTGSTVHVSGGIAV